MTAQTHVGFSKMKKEMLKEEAKQLERKLYKFDLADQPRQSIHIVLGTRGRCFRLVCRKYMYGFFSPA